MSPALMNDAPLMVYNTESREKENFEPITPGKVGMYNCGPTVYDYFHVGNARNFVCADMVRRYLQWRGYEVTFVQNITDIEDKIIARAQKEGVEPSDITERFTKVFFEASASLGVEKADHHPCATKYVGKMIALIKQLEGKGLAYAAEGDVYFRVKAFKDYGKLSGRNIDDMMSGARVEVSEKKEHPGDFALWKAAKEGEPSWNSPWGKGRPGWHIECSVMSMDLLGESFDIHMGGTDLTFPHHENEIAQSEGATGKPFVRYWIHNGFLNIDGEKMSKSLGNFFTIDEVLDKFEAPVVRYFLLSAHYRAKLDFSDASLAEARTALDRLREARAAARRLAREVEADPTDDENVRAVYEKFQAAMDDDFNSPRALAALFDAASAINRLAHQVEEARRKGGDADDDDLTTIARYAAALDEMGGEVLGIQLEAEHADIQHLRDDVAKLLETIAAESGGNQAIVDTLAEGPGDDAPTDALLDHLLDVRNAARKSKAFDVADAIRDQLGVIGFELVDRPEGTEWKRK